MSCVVDKGFFVGVMVEEKEECDRFCRFWGDKVELCCFEWDMICEILVWKLIILFEICEEIMWYIFVFYFCIGYFEDDISFYGNGLVVFFFIKFVDIILYSVVRKEFSIFECDICNFDDFFLCVCQIVFVCFEFWYVFVKFLVFGFFKFGFCLMDCVIFFEVLGKWFESIVVIQRIKIVFLFMIGNFFENSK